METTSKYLPLINVNSPHCAMRVQSAIRTVNNLSDTHVDLGKHQAQLNTNATAQNVREAVAKIRMVGYDVQTEQHTFNTTGITCAGCGKKASDILNTLTGVIVARVDHVTNTAEVEVVHDLLTFDDLLAALRPAGYGLIRNAA